ncbi:MAG: thioredoxin family protein [Alphaproteobacteria bacterium]|nr:thioredoxin family protein [Alphaproteobacteria bacterium]
MKTLKFLLCFLTILFYGSFCFADNVQNWQNDKLNIRVYSQKISTTKINSLIKISLKNGWFISWDNPGDAGTATDFEWNIPSVKLNQSIPQKFVYDNIVGQYGYNDTAYYLFENSFNDNKLQVNISWEACKQECIKESTIIDIDTNKTSDTQYNKAIDEAQQTFLPEKIINAEMLLRYENTEPTVDIFIDNADFFSNTDLIHFAPYQKSLIYVADEQTVGKNSNQTVLSLKLIKPVMPSKGGLLFINDKAYKVNLMPKIDNIDFISGLYIFILAFLGGIILNFMPCVFPVLSLKILSSNFKQRNVKGAILYFTGVVLSFLCLASILFILRKIGTTIGWGFQLQSPLFVIILIIIFATLLLMLFDIIKINPTLLNWLNRKSSLNSFISGFFAVLVASPCTGPFLGAVLGYTLTQSPSLYFLIFVSLGIGYALPFTLLEIFPQTVAKIMPKSGNWMNKLKYILSIPLFLTLIWLGWILFNQLKNSSINDETSAFEPYNENQIISLINSGKPVFIEYTAKWCLTCLLNEKTVLNTKKFQQLAQQNDIHLFKADWTEQDDTIGQSIKSYSRNSVPLYVYYPPNNQNYVLLPQILNFDIVKSVLNQ